jgi:hypothetical protein
MSEEKIEVEQTILLCAFRYALGRQTYIPMVIYDNIRENIDKLSDFTVQKMYQELDVAWEEQQHYAPEGTNMFGDETNQKIWLEIKDYLENELTKRGIDV